MKEQDGGPRIDEGPLLKVTERWGGSVGLMAAFALAHFALMQVGYSLKTSIADPAVMWPASGLALATLWLTPRRLWPAILATQFVVEVATAALWMSAFRPSIVALYTLANMAGALVGASLATWLIPQRIFLRAREVLWFVLGTAGGAMASSLAGAAVHASVLGGFDLPRYLHLWQIWAAGQWAGIMAVAPLVAFWTSPLRGRHPELELRSRTELAVLAALLVGASFYIAAAPPGRAESLLQLPTTIVLLMIIAVMRLPPRWAVALFSMTALTLAALAARSSVGLPPETIFYSVGQLQVFLVTLGLFAFVLSMTLAERSIASRFLRESEHRYRNFIELSTEALWRIELLQPMPVELPAETQLAWLREHARVAEFSQSFELIDPRARAAPQDLRWSAQASWVAALEERIATAQMPDFSIDELRFTVALNGRPHVFAASFNGVVQEGRLLRWWGVARDITQLVDLNTSLLRERERLKSYARQIVSAEEKARRATAVDLHDGIGQSLVGMGMTLEVARQRAAPEVKLLIDEARTRLREVQERTRSMISDLSPPGLYELGLTAALQWLAVYMRTHDQLQVELDTELREEAVKLECRVLVFKLVRELLRNVVKHAGVGEAQVKVRGTSLLLQVEVSDRGRGFEWQLDMFGTARGGGFGLWSIADRVSEAGGQFEVDAAPGAGARFRLVFPLEPGAADSATGLAGLRRA